VYGVVVISANPAAKHLVINVSCAAMRKILAGERDGKRVLHIENPIEGFSVLILCVVAMPVAALVAVNYKRLRRAVLHVFHYFVDSGFEIHG
jgi:hypothetical protein